jgi:hypothetical protein
MDAPHLEALRRKVTPARVRAIERKLKRGENLCGDEGEIWALSCEMTMPKDPEQFESWQVTPVATMLPRFATSRTSRPLSRARAPRGRRVRTSRSSRGSPGRSTSADDGELDADYYGLACARCGARVAILRGIRTCAPCWATTYLALKAAA